MLETGGAMAAIAASNAAIAAQAAHEAEVAKCQIVIREFDSKNTTVGQAQEYSHCIDVVYPQPMSDSSVVALKVVFAIALIGMVAGVLYVRQTERWADWIEYVMAAFLGFFCLPVGIGVIVGIGFGIKWLFS